MWDLPRPGLEPVSPALAGRFSTTAPPGKPYVHSWYIPWNVFPLLPKLDFADWFSLELTAIRLCHSRKLLLLKVTKKLHIAKSIGQFLVLILVILPITIIFNTLDNSTILNTLLLIDLQDTQSPGFLLHNWLRHLGWHPLFSLTIKYRSAQSSDLDPLLYLASFSWSSRSTWDMYTWHHYILMEVSKFQAFPTLPKLSSYIPPMNLSHCLPQLCQ